MFQSHEGGFGQGPGLEAHGGATYCAVSSLHLLDSVDEVLSSAQKERLQKWCLSRQQQGGFSGRTNRQADSSYSFWIGATLQVGKNLTLKVLNFWKFIKKWSGWVSDSYCSLKPLWSGKGEVVPARTSLTLHPPFPPTVL